MLKFDIVVVGGGFAGTAAAIAAGRSGCSVLVVERGNSLGGAASNGLVNPFMPNRTVLGDAPEETELSQGIFAEIVKKLKEMDAMKESGVFHEEYLKLLLNRMALEANANLLYHSYLIDVNKDNGKIGSIIVANKSGKMEIFADYFIDATGDADLAVLSGCPYRLGRESDNLCQPMTLCFRVANVDLEKYKAVKETITPLYNQMQKQGKIKNVREDVLIFHNIVDGVLHFNSTRIVKRNPVDAFDLTKAEIEAREQVFELFEFMKNNIDGFQNAQLLMTGSAIGVRESRMIEGEYVLTGEDLISCKKFEDSIAIGNYDIDIHNPEGSGTSHYYFPKGQYYTIPYRSLLPKNVDNLLVTGRCISVTHEAQASIRIMPIVCCLGEAAGVAASIASKNNISVKEIDIMQLREQLLERGAKIS